MTDDEVERRGYLLELIQFAYFESGGSITEADATDLMVEINTNPKYGYNYAKKNDDILKK